MGLKVFGINKFGLALGCSIGVHIVALAFFGLIGGGDKKPEATEAPAAAAEEAPAAAADSASAAESEDKKEAVKSENKKDAVKPSPRAARPPKGRKPDAKTVKPKPPEPKPVAAKKPETKKAEEAPQQDAPDAVEWKEYEVQSGEGLWTIAKKFGIKAVDLAKANGLKPTEDLKRGQKIKVPAKDSAAD